MKLQEGSCGVAGTSRDSARVRSLGDAEQQANHQIAPKQPGELLGKFGRTPCEQSGRLGPIESAQQLRSNSLVANRISSRLCLGAIDRTARSTMQMLTAVRMVPTMRRAAPGLEIKT